MSGWFEPFGNEMINKGRSEHFFIVPFYSNNSHSHTFIYYNRPTDIYLLYFWLFLAYNINLRQKRKGYLRKFSLKFYLSCRNWRVTPPDPKPVACGCGCEIWSARWPARWATQKWPFNIYDTFIYFYTAKFNLFSFFTF